MTIEIRQAVSGEVGAIENCAAQAYAQYVLRIGREPAPMVADFAGQVANGLVRVATQDGALCGFVVFHERGDAMFLENVAVSPDCQGKGVGRKLIGHVEDAARDRGLGCVELYTNEKMTENLVLYPRLGYLETGRRREDGFDRVYFRKALGPG